MQRNCEIRRKRRVRLLQVCLGAMQEGSRGAMQGSLRHKEKTEGMKEKIVRRKGKEDGKEDGYNL